jgi:hypothetical protein
MIYINISNTNYQELYMTGNSLPFSFLDQTVNILIVSSSTENIVQFETILQPFHIFSLLSVKTLQDAITTMATNRIHICFLDLCTNETKAASSNFIRSITNSTVCIGFSTECSATRVITSVKNGILEVINISGGLQLTPEFSVLLCKSIIVALFYPTYRWWHDDMVANVINTLLTLPKANVTAWAIKAGISATRLRTVCETKFTCSPKHISFIYNCYSLALSYISRCGNTGRRCLPEAVALKEEFKLKCYFHSNYSSFSYLLKGTKTGHTQQDSAF